MRDQLTFPGIAIDSHQLVELLTGEIFHAPPIYILITWHPANRTLDAHRATLGALDDPLQDTHVFAKTRPEEISLLVTPEPVHTKDARGVHQMAPKVEPVVEIVGHV